MLNLFYPIYFVSLNDKFCIGIMMDAIVVMGMSYDTFIVLVWCFSLLASLLNSMSLSKVISSSFQNEEKGDHSGWVMHFFIF